MVRLVCFDFWNTLYENIPNNLKKEYTYISSYFKGNLCSIYLPAI